MTRDEVLTRLRASEADLRHHGVNRAAVFGSIARGKHRADSDIDILVELDETKIVTVYDYAGVKAYIAGMFDGPVDVVDRDGLKPHVRSSATADAIYAF